MPRMTKLLLLTINRRKYNLIVRKTILVVDNDKDVRKILSAGKLANSFGSRW